MNPYFVPTAENSFTGKPQILEAIQEVKEQAGPPPACVVKLIGITPGISRRALVWRAAPR
ncbi:MAG: hypothetical protein ABSB35_22340 [Bryobacteraceae bacterium]|jgi:hypothetical protein